MLEIPWAAKPRDLRCTSAFVATSTPCVGSSRNRIRGSAASHFESTTFCWLPPERLRTTCRGETALMRRRSMNRWASDRSARGRRMPPGVSPCGSTASDALAAIDMGWTRPWLRRSSGR